LQQKIRKYKCIIQQKEEKAQQDLKNANRKNEKLQLKIQCCVCKTNDKNIMFMPCRHLHCCETCTDKIISVNKKCPMCMTVIEEKVKVFN